ncbi:MAG: TIGR04282 family arsenosugar biosynthesis glycosyltransferase [Anaerolineales bacterium]
MKNHLIVFAKRPLAGHAKTRLGEKIGLEESAGIYARFLYQSLFELVALERADIIIELSLASSADVPYFRFAFPEFQISSQTGGNLGQRFTKSFQKAFDQGATAVVVIGTDIPDLNRTILQSAFDALSENEVVIGPDLDGGYYLIGTRLRDATLFKNIDWSSERVFQQTERLILAQGLTMFYLPTLSDVDTDEDFRRWLAKRASQND